MYRHIRTALTSTLPWKSAYIQTFCIPPHLLASPVSWLVSSGCLSSFSHLTTIIDSVYRGHWDLLITLAPRATCTAIATATATSTPNKDFKVMNTASTLLPLIPYLPPTEDSLPTCIEPPTSSDNSDSEFDIEIITHQNAISKMSAQDGAIVIHTAYNHPPTVTKGKLMPKIIMEFEQACHTFFDNAKGGIADGSCVYFLHSKTHSYAIGSHLIRKNL